MIMINEEFPEDLLTKYNQTIYHKVFENNRIEAKWEEEYLRIAIPIRINKLATSFERLIEICAYSK